MKNRILISLITLFLTTNFAFAELGFNDGSDYTGESFFAPAKMLGEEQNAEGSESNASEESKTIPPLKRIRLGIQDKLKQHEMKKYDIAPMPTDNNYVGEVETSEYASKEVKDEFDEDMLPDGFEADAESVAENEKIKKGFFKRKNKTKKITKTDTEDIILDCESVDYDTPNYTIHAKGNVNVEFVKQGVVLKSDIMTFDRIKNTVKAEGNVRIIKNDQVITGDYIFVDLNEENALIENPLTRTSNIEMKAQKCYVYGDKIVQENGTLTADGSFPINFIPNRNAPVLGGMLTKENETLSTDIQSGDISAKAHSIKITQNGDLETIAIKKFRLRKGSHTLLKVPAVKIYTNKNRDYAESNLWEVGSYRGLGIYGGPDWVFELPKGSVLKVMPLLTYEKGFGVGAMGRFSSGTNQTVAAYGTSASKFILYGKQQLDDKLIFHYGINSYMDEWFLGRRRPKYGADLVYENQYSSNNFLLKNRMSSFMHRAEMGYYNDLDFDNSYENIKGSNMGTTRFRYMAQAQQNFFNYVNKDKLTAFSFGVMGQGSAAIYGTGDTQFIGRIGPTLHTQYKRWMQDISYLFSVYEDGTPMPVFDAYRYGKQNLYVREYLRLCRYVTLSWFGSICLSNDSPNDQRIQENAFYLSFGPDDFKLHIGYDFMRRNMYCTVEVMMDAKGANLEYDTFEVKQKKKTEEDKVAKKQDDTDNGYKAPTKPKVLQKAVVENVKIMEDVL